MPYLEGPARICRVCQKPEEEHFWKCVAYGCKKPVLVQGNSPVLHAYKDHDARTGVRHRAGVELACPSGLAVAQSGKPWSKCHRPEAGGALCQHEECANDRGMSPEMSAHMAMLDNARVAAQAAEQSPREEKEAREVHAVLDRNVQKRKRGATAEDSGELPAVPRTITVEVTKVEETETTL